MVSAQSNNSGPSLPPAGNFTSSSVSIPAEPRKSPTNTPDEASTKPENSFAYTCAAGTGVPASFKQTKTGDVLQPDAASS
jgi:hypothetical protein